MGHDILKSDIEYLKKNKIKQLEIKYDFNFFKIIKNKLDKTKKVFEFISTT